MRVKVSLLIITTILFGCVTFVSPGFARTFKEDQLRYERVRTAVKQKDSHLKQFFAKQGIEFEKITSAGGVFFSF